ncbi:unnamed protein product [Effrenium voratum]|nr:unnamed protein product [Effrenium voratum]
MAVSRRQRKVAETLQDSRDLFLYPDSRLAAAAAAEAEELARLFRTPKEQRASCSSLAQPRALPEAELPQEPQSIPRSWAEQQAYLRELAEPRQPELELLPERRCDRSLAEQQRRCAELAQPRIQRGTDDVAAWRDELAFKAAALVPEEVQAARDLLEKMRCRPRSAKKVREAKAPAPEVEEQLKELKAAVEEILWVALLQVRSCPKPQTAAAAGSVEERLGALLISSVGPALRPVARRLLGPGQGLARRLRTEFPKLARHLCFREAEDLEPPQSSWQEEEVSLHLAKARECRDSLLAMDLIKDAVARLGDLEPRA